MQDGDRSMAARAAWLSYVGGYTQEDIAGRLGVSRVKVNRLIADAIETGLVRVFIEGTAAECVALEDAIAARWGLDFCTVVPNMDEGGLPLRTLATAGAHYLSRVLDRGEVKLIGVGHGRTLAASVEYLTRTAAAHIRFVSLLGGVTRKFAANPHDVMHRLAERTGAQAYVMPVPFVANTAEDREVLLGQRGISDVFDLASRSDLMFVGIGTAEREASLVATGMIEHSE
ncbi:MAG: hypothetical protein QOK29_4034, partial [Rhodospirillaceae bacterium]|nr:hypothetical protein [Rhodospirillaceae bacterium]